MIFSGMRPGDSMLNRLILAIHLHADDEGLTCRTRVDELAAASRLSVKEAVQLLGRLVDLGQVTELGGEPFSAEHPIVLVLMDHEAAEWYIKETRRAAGRQPAFPHPADALRGRWN